MQIAYGEGKFGEVVLGFYPSVAPVTVAHILKLVRMGGYNTNEIFRVDRGFVAQVQGVDGGRRAPMSKALRAEATKKVPDEFSSSIKHTRGMPGPGAYFRDFQVGARSRRRFAPPRILCAPDSLTRFGASETTPRPHPASRTASSCART